MASKSDVEQFHGIPIISWDDIFMECLLLIQILLEPCSLLLTWLFQLVDKLLQYNDD